MSVLALGSSKMALTISSRVSLCHWVFTNIDGKRYFMNENVTYTQQTVTCSSQTTEFFFFALRLSSVFAPLHEQVFSDWLPRHGVTLSLAKTEKFSSCCEDCDKPRVWYVPCFISCSCFTANELKWLRLKAAVCITYFVFSVLDNAEKKMLLFRLQWKVSVVEHG